MNTYAITYESELTPITLEIVADDPYTACMMLGRKTKTKKVKVLKIVVNPMPEVIWNGH